MDRAWRSHLSDQLEKWEERGLTRTEKVFSTAQLPHSIVDGHSVRLFSSSNYLGLSTHPDVVRSAVQAAEQYGTGSGGSRLTTGTTTLHRELEKELAEWLGYPDCVVLGTGYQANLAVLMTLGGPDVTIHSEAGNHASIIDGCRMARGAGAQVRVFSLEEGPDLMAEGRNLVITDGLFSMSGNVAPVADLVERSPGALVVVDDAHGVGTLGDGRGCAAPLPADHRPDLLVGTLSKALGSEGGFICADESMCTLLRNRARSYIYSTSLSAPVIAASLAAVRLVRRDQGLVERLQDNAEQIRAGLESVVPAGSLGATASPIIPVAVGDERKAMKVSAELRNRGMHVPAIRYPTVPYGKAMLRVTAMATHTTTDIRALTGALRELLGT